MSKDDAIKVDIWSDVACPWCYLGKHRFEAALKEFAARPDAPKVEVEYHSFQLSPDLPADFDGAHDEYLANRFGWPPEQVAASNRNLQTLGAPYGLLYDFSTNRTANTAKAHELLHYAKAHGRQREVKEALFRAHFDEGIHIGTVEKLADIAAKAGLDRDDAVRALQSGTYAEAVEADKDIASGLGINGVPFFVIDSKYGLSGAQEPATFLKALERVTAEKV